MPFKVNKSKAIKSSYGSPHQLVVRKKNKKRKNRSANSHNHSKVAFDKICKEICMRVDPFHRESCCKMIDSSSTPCFNMKFRSRGSLATLGSGEAVLLVLPRLNNPILRATTITGGVMTANSYQALDGYNTTEMEGYRIVSVAIRVFSSVSTADCQGVVNIKCGTDVEYATSINETMISERLTVPVYQCDLSGVLVSGHEQTFRLMADTAFDKDFPSVQIGIVGAVASTAILHYEIEFNAEITPVGGTFAANLVTPAGPDIPAVESTISNVKSKMPTVNDNTKESLGSKILRVVEDEAAVLVKGLGQAAVGFITAML